ncbi:MAG: dihydroorotase [Bacillota bacterium]
MDDLKITNGAVYMNGDFYRVNVYVKDGRISALTDDVREAKETYDASGAMVLPGFIDPHVHFSLEVGAHKTADDFESGSRAAAFGGVTTFVDFLDPTATVDALEKAFEKRIEEAKASTLDYKLHATLKSPEDSVESYVNAMRRLGLDTLKVFTTYSDSGRRTGDEAIKQLIGLTVPHKFLLLAHIENDDLITLNKDFTHEDLPKSRPSESETLEALKLADFVKETGGRLYMVHLSSGHTLKALKHKFPGILNTRFFVESCPQYFMFKRDCLHKKNGHLYTCAPPLRSMMEQHYLRNHFEDIHTIGTDHAPFMKQEKEETLLKDIPLGLGSIEHTFNVLYHLKGVSVIDKMTVNPAKRMGLFPKKGVLKVGSDADIAIVKLREPYKIKANHSACDYSLYEGLEASTQIVSTISRGRFVVKDGVFTKQKGEFLRGEGIDA